MTAFATLPVSDRAAVLSLLSRLLLYEVDDELLEQLERDEIAETLEGLAAGARAEIRAARTTAEAREALDVEYCRLFVLPTGVSPHASAWAEGDAAAARLAVRDAMGELFDALHLRLRESGRGGAPADHVGTVLALAAVALERDGDGDLPEEAMRLLRPWAGTFAARVASATTSRLYRATALLLGAVLGG